MQSQCRTNEIHDLILQTHTFSFFFFFNDTATTEIYTLSLHDALPILRSLRLLRVSGIVMRLRMFLLLITFLKASHSFRKVISKIGRAVQQECRDRYRMPSSA